MFLLFPTIAPSCLSPFSSILSYYFEPTQEGIDGFLSQTATCLRHLIQVPEVKSLDGPRVQFTQNYFYRIAKLERSCTAFSEVQAAKPEAATWAEAAIP